MSAGQALGCACGVHLSTLPRTCPRAIACGPLNEAGGMKGAAQPGTVRTLTELTPLAAVSLPPLSVFIYWDHQI